jgi:hypothetical protein
MFTGMSLKVRNEIESYDIILTQSGIHGFFLS